MNVSAFIGILLVGAMVWFAAITSDISPEALWNLPGLIVVVGGTAAATLISFDMRGIQRSFAAIWIVLTRGSRQTNWDVEDLTAFDRVAPQFANRGQCSDLPDRESVPQARRGDAH